ncbi:MAG: tetratricopeptide repeat protein [Candidatus Melainabacteria bacterium]|nr:tetratricopeptide repeat protein [Candidatus Melainabacteria bacterium]
MQERDSQRSSRPVSKVGGTSCLGVVLFLIWVLLGAGFSFVFTLGDPLLRSFVVVLVLIWAVLGPFALSFFLVNLSSWLLHNGFYKASVAVAGMGTTVDDAIVPLLHVCGMFDSPIAVMNLLNRASAMMCLGQFKEAAAKLELAMDKSQGAIGWDHILTQLVVGQMASCYFYLGRFSEAEKFFRRGIAAKKVQLKPEEQRENDSPLAIVTALAGDMYGLGGLFEKQSKFALAEEQYKQAIETIDLHVFEDTYFLANNLNALGDLLVRTGRTDEAVDYINRAFRIRKQIFPEKDLMIASSFHSLGCLRFKQGNLYEAKRYLADALSIKESFLGKAHPDLADTYRATGELEAAMNNFAVSEKYLSKSLAILEENFGTHPDISSVLESLSKLYDKSGQSDKSAEYMQRAEAIKNH